MKDERYCAKEVKDKNVGAVKFRTVVVLALAPILVKIFSRPADFENQSLLVNLKTLRVGSSTSTATGSHASEHA